jgi:hypothetical protein
VQGHGAALRETRDRNPRGRNSCADLALDERADRGCRGLQAGEILRRTPVDPDDVVPGAHGVTVVQRHRAHRRVRKDETQAGHAVVEQLGHQRLEVVAVGAEAVHPDDGERGLGSGFYDDAFEGRQIDSFRPVLSS